MGRAMLDGSNPCAKQISLDWSLHASQTIPTNVNLLYIFQEIEVVNIKRTATDLFLN